MFITSILRLHPNATDPNPTTFERQRIGSFKMCWTAGFRSLQPPYLFSSSISPQCLSCAILLRPFVNSFSFDVHQTLFALRFFVLTVFSYLSTVWLSSFRMLSRPIWSMRERAKARDVIRIIIFKLQHPLKSLPPLLPDHLLISGCRIPPKPANHF